MRSRSIQLVTLNLFVGLPMVIGTFETLVRGRFILAQSGVPNWEKIQLTSQDRFSSGAFRFHVDVERQLVTVTFGNRVTAEEIGEYVQKLRTDPGFEPSFSEIADLREAKEIDLQADEFLKLADEVDPFSPQAKRAFLARTSTQNHAARMHKILRSQRNIEIFGTLEDAERWIES
jgi:hypothetical protein